MLNAFPGLSPIPRLRDSSKFVLAYQGSDLYGSALVGTVSGITVSYGSEIWFTTYWTDYISMVYDPINDRIVFALRYVNGGGEYGKVRVGEVVGSLMSMKSSAIFSTVYCDEVSATRDPTTNKIYIAYSDSTTGYSGTVRPMKTSPSPY